MGARKMRGSKPEDLEEMNVDCPAREEATGECSGLASPAVKGEGCDDLAGAGEAEALAGDEGLHDADAPGGDAVSQRASVQGDGLGECDTDRKDSVAVGDACEPAGAAVIEARARADGLDECDADGRDGMEGGFARELAGTAAIEALSQADELGECDTNGRDGKGVGGACEQAGTAVIEVPAQADASSAPPWDEEDACAGEWDALAEMADDADAGADEDDLCAGSEDAADSDGDAHEPHLAQGSIGDESACGLIGEGDPDEDVAQAQALLGGCWRQDGSAVLTCPENDEEESGGEDDLGRFDIHDPHQLGELGEHIAARYLRMYDYKILERNYRCHQGEADIICTKDDSIVLVEVKTRLGADAHPEDAVNASKLLRYKRITLEYLMSHEWFENVRLDVLAVNIVEAHRAQVHHFVGVCAWEG